MKRILFITPFVPSLQGAAMKFTKKTIESLSNDFIVDLVYFKYADDDIYLPKNKNINVLSVFPISIKTKLLGISQKPWLYPIFTVRYSRKLKKYFNELIQNNSYSLIFLDHSQTFIYGMRITNIPKILMSHDIIFQRVYRTSNKLLSWFARISENKMMHQSNATIFSFSTKDQQIISNCYKLSSKVTNGVVDDRVLNIFPDTINDYYVLFGDWKRLDNYNGLMWFIQNVYDKLPDGLCLKIIGRGMPEQYLQEIVKRSKIEVLGYVDNPYQIISNSQAMICPLFSGAGVKFKVIEALACGVPIIGTDIAFEGIPNDYLAFMIEANTAEDFLEQMDTSHYTIKQRIAMKKMFIQTYLNDQIIDFMSDNNNDK